MAPRALVSRIDRLWICASPKASCRSVSDFAWEVAQVKTVRVPVRARVIAFRNPYRRLISAYLNKYVEHSKYRQASLQRCSAARLDSFAEFVDELDHWGFRCIDKVHFRPQVRRYRGWRFDRVFDAEDLEPLRLYVNGLCGTDVAMPFRVRPDRPSQLRDRGSDAPDVAAAAAAAAERLDAQAPASSPNTAVLHPVPSAAAAWELPLDQLRPLLAARQAPPYASFYNAQLAGQVRRIYRADFRFLERALHRGLLEASLHSRLTGL